MGKSLIIKGADFSNSALARVGYVYSETVSLVNNQDVTINCDVVAGKTYAIYTDSRRYRLDLSISQGNSVLATFKTFDNSNVKADTSGTIFTATSDGTIQVKGNGNASCDFVIKEAFFVAEKAAVVPSSAETIAELKAGFKYFINIPEIQLKSGVSPIQAFAFISIYNSTLYSVIQDSTNSGGYCVNASVDGLLKENGGINVDQCDSYTVKIYAVEKEF